MRKTPFKYLVLLILLLPVFGHAETADHTFGFTTQKCASYADAARQTRLEDAAAYTFLAIDEEQNGCLNTSAGWIEKSAVQTLRINYLEPRSVVFITASQMYATGNTNHPIGVRIPAGTMMTVRYGMEAQQSWYIVEYEGAWGFVPRSVTESMGSAAAPAAVSGRVLAIATESTPVYAYPNALSVTKKHFAAETAVILESGTDAYYETSLQGKRVYLNKNDVTVLLTEEAGSATEAWADGALDVWNVPSEAWGKRIGTATITGILPIAYRIGNWCSVSFGAVEGFVREDSLSIAGGGYMQYSLYLSLSTKVLCVLDANGDVVFGTKAAVGTGTPSGAFTLESRTDWQYIQPNYAPYCMAFSGDVNLRGPLCWGRSTETARLDHMDDFGQAVTDGSIVIPAAEAQWIYFHCPAGTQIRIEP